MRCMPNPSKARIPIPYCPSLRHAVRQIEDVVKIDGIDDMREFSIGIRKYLEAVLGRPEQKGDYFARYRTPRYAPKTKIQTHD